MKPTSMIKGTLIVFAILMAVPEPLDAVLGTRRRTSRRTAVVVGTSVHAADSAAMAQSQQQAAAAQQQAAAAEAEADAAKQEAAEAQQPAAAAAPPAVAAPPAASAPAAAGKKLPMGTIVTALPPGAVATPVDGVQYYYAGGNFYRAVFQGNQLVYVTAEPK